jgi:hypothetical protein
MRQKRTWHVRRTGEPMATGQQRWDRAYQHLLQWAAMPRPAPTVAAEPPTSPEMCHASSDVRPRLDRSPGRAADD